MAFFRSCAIAFGIVAFGLSDVQAGPADWSFHAHLDRGQSFHQDIGRRLVLALEPTEFGWHLDVRPQERQNGIGFASIATPPLHGPTALDIEGWQFRNTGNTAANDGSVNAPQLRRDFSFVLNEAGANELADEIASFQEGKTTDLPLKALVGRGTITISNLKLGNLVTGSRARIESMDVTVALHLPE